jgi:hypothetical protein
MRNFLHRNSLQFMAPLTALQTASFSAAHSWHSFTPVSGRKTMTLVGSIGRTVAAMAVTVTMAHAQEVNDYPTSARVEYVFGCLKANGETRQAIEQCSCSIDIVASLVPYARYVTAETVLSMAQVRGNLGGQFRTSEQATSALNELRRAQAEAEVRCF